ncbi:MAG: VacJ family lipoprotein [Betaproteobacteria bacterium]|nr:VacJ family lipoprotein [Betaproteobacteria bacterium]
MKFSFPLFLLAAAVSVGGCAPARHSFEEEGAFDPIEPINRAVYSFNKKLDAVTLRPAAKVYSHMPQPVQTALGNLFFNLGEPKNIANHALQGRGKDAAVSAARLVFNTAFGLGGLVDVAAKVDVGRRENDFGATIRAYSGNGGAYLVLPVLGPSSLADAPGRAADIAASPPTYLKSDTARAIIGGVGAVNLRAEFLRLEYLLEGALDEYTYVRDVREELRRQEVAAGLRGTFLDGGK